MTRKSNVTAMAVVKQTAFGNFDEPTSGDLYPISNCQPQFQGVTTENTEYTGTTEKNGPTVVGEISGFTFDINLRPPGGADVPSADAYIPGLFLQAAKFTETRTTTSIPASPEALAAGSTTTATLGAGAGSTDDLYNGMAIQIQDEGATLPLQLTGISDYVGSTKVATLAQTLSGTPSGNYVIPKQLSYQRAPSATPPWLSMQFWLDGLAYDLRDVAISSLGIVLPTANVRGNLSDPVLRVGVTGIIDDYYDEATPAIPSLGATPQFRDGKCYAAGFAIGGSSLDFNFNLRQGFPPDANYQQGHRPGEIVEGRTQISGERLAELKADLDTRALAQAQAYHALLAQYGYTSGNIVQIVVPAFRWNYQSPGLGGDYITETGDLFVDVASRNVCLNFPYGTALS